MAKICKDFLFANKRISTLLEKSNSKYIFVDFDGDSDKELAMSRSMESGNTNRYKTESNHFYDTWDNQLQIEFDIMKDQCLHDSQAELVISRNEIRDITRWLTSSRTPEWLRVESDEDDSVLFYKGWFSNIETWVDSDRVYGLRLYFTCTSSFAYTDEIVNEISVSNEYKYILIENNSDELNTYCYPTFEIRPKSNGQIFICNQSDYDLLETGVLTQSTSYFNSLLAVIENYAKLNGYTVEHIGTGAMNIVPVCNDTAIQFKLVDVYDNETMCVAFYFTNTKEYRIITGGFMYMDVYKDLNVYVNTKELQIVDSIGRMITYDKLGVQDTGFVYWPRLINGNNSILLYGNFDITIKHRESRKVGEA